MAWINYKGLLIPDTLIGVGGINLIDDLKELADRIGPVNYTATVDPTVGDDINDDYHVGSRWYNQSLDKIFECLDNTAGAAVWIELTTNVNFPSNYFPKRSETLFHMNANVVAGSSLTKLTEAAQSFNHYLYQSPSANNDEWTHSTFLQAGTYSLILLGLTGEDCGKLDLSIKEYGASSYTTIVTAQDWYAASGVIDHEKTVSSIVISTTGRVILRGKVNGKHASSSDYYIYLTAYWFKQSTD